MSDVVIIVGTKRGKEDVPFSEISQMIGRAGREHGKDGIAYIISEDRDVDISNEQNVANSSLNTVDMVAFHLLPEICLGTVRSIKDANDWYSMTLAYKQGKRIDINEVLKYLIDNRAIHDTIEPTVLGSVSSSMYLNPAAVRQWVDNFDMLFYEGLENNDGAIAWALGNNPYYKASCGFIDNSEIVETCKDMIPRQLHVTTGCVIGVTIWFGTLGIVSCGKMKNNVLSFRDDIGRICKCMVNIDNDRSRWGKNEFFDELIWRVKRGIPKALISLCRIKGVTKGMAQFLDSKGIHSLKEIRENMDSLSCELNEDQIEEIKRVAYGLC